MGTATMRADATFIDLEFETVDHGAPLGDIASSLVTLHDLLRDLAAIRADGSVAEFRDIQVVAIDLTRPLTIRLSLLAISPEAVRAFQEICRDIIRSRDHDIDETRLARIRRIVGDITEKETRRLSSQMATLQNARVPLKRVVVKKS